MAPQGSAVGVTDLRHCKRKVFYYYDPSVGNYHYGIGHPMKPQRIRLTHEIIEQYGMLRRLHVYRPTPLPFQELASFHDPIYLRYLNGVSGDLKIGWKHRFSERFNIGEDCPPFAGCYDFSTLCAGGSVAAAKRLINGDCDVAINWSGGLHHAKKSEASGFCFINDAVLAIQELLTYFQRVLYIDIDIHHGDGVEEAFFTSNRVFTLSLHKYGDFFPGTGSLFDIGADKGKYYTMNVPIEEGISDDDYEDLFGVISQKLNDYYRPDVIVMQCGADSLAGDRIGVFNLTTRAHGSCVDLILKFNLPTLLLGGGGYTVRNVSRCWTYETAVALGEKDDISDDLPFNTYYDDFGPEFKLHTKPLNWRNKNTKESLSRMKTKLFEHLRKMSSYKPPEYENGIKIRDPRRLAAMKQAAAAAVSGSSLVGGVDMSIFRPFFAVDTVDAEAVMHDAADPDVRVPEVDRNMFREPLEDIADRAETGCSSELHAETSAGRVKNSHAAQQRQNESHRSVVAESSMLQFAGPGALGPADLAAAKSDSVIEPMEEDGISDADLLEAAAMQDDEQEDDELEKSENDTKHSLKRKRMSLMTDYRRLQERMSDADEDDINPPTTPFVGVSAVQEEDALAMLDGAKSGKPTIDELIKSQSPPSVSADSTTLLYPTDPTGHTSHVAINMEPTTPPGMPQSVVSKTSSTESTPSSSAQMSSRRSRRLANRSTQNGNEPL